MEAFKPGDGSHMHRLCQRLWPICRSITGQGFRDSLHILREYLPDIQISETPTGTQCFDWTVPDEWNIREAYIITPNGEKICDLKSNNLHVLGYSEPVSLSLSLEELQSHLYSLPDQPDAIPYVTSYYKRRWGFCLSENQRQSLLEGTYKVHIDSDLEPGNLTIGELILRGETKDEILLSTYLCHPSMANNELSGPVVTTHLARWLEGLERRKYTYRILFIPETIGSITYLSQHAEYMKEHTKAGFVITCVGDDRSYSYLPSRQGTSLADRAARHVLHHLGKSETIQEYTYLDRGSDERQYCSPGIDLPVCSLMRTRYGSYPEYHTSLDDLNLVTSAGLAGGFNALKSCLHILEQNCYPKALMPCEPQLGKRGLYPTISTKDSGGQVRSMMNLLAYADGKHSLLDIAELCDVPMGDLSQFTEKLLKGGVIRLSHQEW